MVGWCNENEKTWKRSRGSEEKGKVGLSLESLPHPFLSYFPSMHDGANNRPNPIE